MSKPETYQAVRTHSKPEATKLVKRVAADKNKLQSQQASGGKTETVKTAGVGCAPLGLL